MVIKAIKNLIGLLTEEGLLIVTAPVGYNEFLDKKANENELPLSEQTFFCRDKGNEWSEVAMKVAMSQTMVALSLVQMLYLLGCIEVIVLEDSLKIVFTLR